MPHDEQFQLFIVAIDESPIGALPASDSARALEARLRDWGIASTRRVPATKSGEVRAALAEWADDDDAAPSSFVFWAGHGVDDGLRHWLCTSETTLPANGGNAIAAVDLADTLRANGRRRSLDGDGHAWTVLVLDCCGAAVGVTNIVHELTRIPGEFPRNCVLLPVAEGGAYAGRFVTKFAETLDALTPNDVRVPLFDLLRAVADRLGDALPFGTLPGAVELIGSRPARPVLTVNLEAEEELRRAMAALPEHVRAHFVTMARGGEAGEPAWYFSGREAELEHLATWLTSAQSGMLVVTGKPGSGKSALLGYAVTLADAELVHAMRAAGLPVDVPAAQQPPAGVFDVTLHLTGMTAAQTLRAVGEAAGVDDWHSTLITTLRERSRTGVRFTVLADALDEALEPIPVARLLRRLGNIAGVRVVVGSRRSLGEALDTRASDEHDELMHELGSAERLVVEQDSDAVKKYAVRRLGSRGSPYHDQPEPVEALAARIARREQPFLFARLATGELLRRPAFSATSPELDDLLGGDHSGLFAEAVARLSRQHPSAGALLDALAWSRGRGLPRLGLWGVAANSLHPEAIVDENAIDRLLDAGAPYITLDGENGQSTYRLAHQTFAEHLRARRTSYNADAKIAAGVQEAIAGRGGWETANAYAVRYLAQHLGRDVSALRQLCADVSYLRRGLEVLGVDGLAALLDEIHRDSRVELAGQIASAVRRSRIPLSRDPAQLGPQLRIRLPISPETRPLLNALDESWQGTWLRARAATLDWRNELDATLKFDAYVRAIGSGEVDGRVTFVIAAGSQVYVWDPRTATAELLPGLEFEPTAVTAATVAGRSLIVATNAQQASVFDTDRQTWRELAAEVDGAREIALTEVHEHAALAVASKDMLRIYDLHRSGTHLSRGVENVRALATVADGIRVVTTDGRKFSVTDMVSGPDSIWRNIDVATATMPPDLSADQLLWALGPSDESPGVALAAAGSGSSLWFTEDLGWQSSAAQAQLRTSWLALCRRARDANAELVTEAAKAHQELISALRLVISELPAAVRLRLLVPEGANLEGFPLGRHRDVDPATPNLEHAAQTYGGLEDVRVQILSKCDSERRARIEEYERNVWERGQALAYRLDDAVRQELEGSARGRSTDSDAFSWMVRDAWIRAAEESFSPLLEWAETPFWADTLAWFGERPRQTVAAQVDGSIDRILNAAHPAVRARDAVAVEVRPTRLRDSERLEFNAPVRALTVSSVDNRILLAAVSGDAHERGLVLSREAARGWPGPARLDREVLAIVRDKRTLFALTDGGQLVRFEEGHTGGRLPKPGRVARLLFGGTHARLAAPVDPEAPDMARAFGILGDRPVTLRAARGGAVTVYHATTGKRLRAAPDTGAGEPVSQINAGRDLIVLACGGEMRLLDGLTLEQLPADWIPAGVNAVAIGRVLGRLVVATGNSGGELELWDLQDRSRVTSITLDSGIQRLWMVGGSMPLVARTVDDRFHVMSVVNGGTSRK